jgi:hypothetical protein
MGALRPLELDAQEAPASIALDATMAIVILRFKTISG